MALVQTSAIILGARPLGEADLRVVLLTPDLGKVRAAAKNARKSRRRFSGGLPGGACGEVDLVPGRHADALWRLEHFRSQWSLVDLGRDLERFAYVAYLCELTDRLIDEPEPEPVRFSALLEALERTLTRGPDAGCLRRYELRLLDSLGLAPALERCCVCGVGTSDATATPDGVAFDLARGGVLCPDHAPAAHERLGGNVLRMAGLLMRSEDPSEVLETLRGQGPSERRALRDLTRDILRSHLRSPLRSLEFLSQWVPKT